MEGRPGVPDARELSEWIVRSAPDGLWVFDEQGRTVFANARLAEMFGRTTAEMDGFSVFDALDEVGQQQFRGHLAGLAASAEPGDNIECSMLRKDGERFWALVSHTPLHDDDGRHRGWLHRVTEFSDQRRLLDRLQQREQQLAEAQSIARVGSWEWDVGSDLVTWSDELYRIYGIEPGGFTPSYDGFLAGIHPDDRDVVNARVGAALSGADGFEFDARILRSGRPAWIRGRGRVTRDDEGRVVRMGGTAQDITEARRLEAARALLQAIATAANEADSLRTLLPTAMAEVRRHTGWRAAAAFLTESHEDAGAPRSLAPVALGDDQDQPEATDLARQLAREASQSARLVTRHTDGGTVWVAAPAVVAGAVDGVVVLDTGVPEDPAEADLALVGQVAEIFARVAERHHTSRALRRARDEAMAASEAAEEASRMKSEFLATMSHEIRTPLNGVIGLTELLSRTDLTEHQRRLTDGVDQAGRTLLGLVNNILDFSKIEAGHLDLESVDFDPRAIVEQSAGIVAERARAKSLELAVSCHPRVPGAVRGDPVRFGQVIANLASNAVKFTSEGEVVIRATVGSGRAGDPGTVLRVEVRDTGVGVAPDMQERLFDAFTQADSSTTRQYGGTGLGLAISRRIVTALGGDIGVESEDGAGSTFWFTAAFEPAEAPDLAPTPATAAALAGLRVLVVDDNETNRFILTEQLATWRATATAVESAEEALARLEEADTVGRPYDVALLDYLMPGTDGLELARRVRADRRHDGTRLVLLTSALAPPGPPGTPLPVELWLTKPVLPSQLHTALAHLVGDGARPSRPRPAVAPPRDGEDGSRVLVVEDNPVNQVVAEGILESLGYAVVLASNGAEGVSAFADAPHEVVAVLMDCQMPVMDGYDATRSIREMEGPGARVPIIAMTASAVAGERERCLGAGMDDFLTKPVDVALLKATLARWTGSSRPGAGNGPVADDTGANGGRPTGVPSDRDGRGAPDVLDESRLAELVDLDPEDPSLVLRFIDRFEANAVQTVAQMREAQQAGRTDHLNRLAHSLKGTAANLGVVRLAALCAEMEHRCADADADAVEVVSVEDGEIDAVEREVRTGAEALQAFGAGLRRDPVSDGA